MSNINLYRDSLEHCFEQLELIERRIINEAKKGVLAQGSSLELSTRALATLLALFVSRFDYEFKKEQGE